MENYSEFATVYDIFMDNIPYENWSEYLIGLLKEYEICDGLILDLGCGTGTRVFNTSNLIKSLQTA